MTIGSVDKRTGDWGSKMMNMSSLDAGEKSEIVNLAKSEIDHHTLADPIIDMTCYLWMPNGYFNIMNWSLYDFEQFW